MSTKRDTTLKYTEDLADEEDPKYANLTQFETTTGIGSKERAEANTIIDGWFERHGPDLQNFKKTANQEKVKPLVLLLYNHLAPHFTDKPATFINASLMALIRRNRSNKRRKVRREDSEEETTLENMVPLSLKYIPAKANTGVHAATTSTPVQPPDVAITAVAKTYEIRAKRMLPAGPTGDLSPATVADVIPPVPNSEKDLSSHISFDMWTNILKEDIGYTDVDIINYEFGDFTTGITGDRKFRAAIIDANRRRLPYAEFDVFSNGRAVLRQTLPPKRTAKPNQDGASDDFVVPSPKGRSSNRHNKRRKTGKQNWKTTSSSESDNDIQEKRSIHCVAAEEQASVDISMSPDMNVPLASLSDRWETLEQDEQRPGISRRSSSPAAPTEHMMIDISNKCPEEVPIPTNAESQAAATPSTAATIDRIKERPEQADTTTTAESQPTATRIENEITIIHEGKEEDLNTVKDIQTTPTSTAEELMANVKLTATEHLHEQGRWDKCARLFFHNPHNLDPSERIHIPGLRTPLYLYQAFGVYVMFEMELFQGGGYNADDMGLGKTIELLGVICLNRILEEAHAEVKAARKNKRFDKHLARGTSDSPQLSDAQCPSGRKFGIECPCVDHGPATRLKPQAGPNLIVVPAGLILNWLQEAKRHLDPSNKPLPWEIRHAYGDRKVNQLAKKLSIDDRILLERQADENNVLRSQFGQSRTIVVTTKLSYRGHVKDVMRVITNPPKLPRGRVPTPVKRELKIGWGRVTADEAHTEVSMTATTIHLFKTFGTDVRKWFLTGTPFESSPAQMAAWIDTIEAPYWTGSIAKNSWPEKYQHQKKLKECTQAKLREMGKIHKRLVDKKEENNGVRDNYVRTLTTVLGTLWLKRSATQSTFFGHALTDVPHNKHYEVDCQLPSRFFELVNSPIATITNEMRKTLERKIRDWRLNNCLGEEPQMNLNNWLKEVRRLRVLSTFPKLGELKETKDLPLSGTEDRQRGWIRKEQGHPYHLQRCGSPYENHIEEICSEQNSTKINAINRLIQESWEPGEKAIFCTMGPTVALIVYWYIRLVLKAPVALIHSALSKSDAMEIIWLFQEDPDAITRNPNLTPPQYIVSTTKLIGVGYTLHRAKRLVIIDPEWMDRDHEQAKKRINRIGQREKTSTYALRCVGSHVEETIYDRQNRRMHLVRLALDPDNFAQDTYERGVGDDVEDDVQPIDVENRLEEAKSA